MQTIMIGPRSAGAACLAGLLLLVAGCADEPVSPIDERGAAEPAPTPALEALLTCFMDVSVGMMDCDSASPGLDDSESGPRANLIIGSQHQFVRLANDTPSVSGDLWSARVTVQNLSLQPFATADGNTPHADGVRVFFVDEPSNGVEVTNHDGTADFLGTDPAKYYAYSGTDLGADAILSPGEISAAKSWEFALNGATEFVFSVLISTTVPNPDPDAYSVHLTRVVAGGMHTCGESSDGNVYCWGQNTYGQLGDGTTVDRWTPARVKAPGNIKLSRLSLGNRHTCAEGSNNEVYCWGHNSRGQLGDGTQTDRNTPVPARAPTSIALSGPAAGGEHTCAEGSDGNVYCWGFNASGQHGNGTDTTSSVPTRALSPSNITLTGLVAGSSHTCAEGSDGNAYCWGHNSRGQLGDSTQMNRYTPVPVRAPGGVTLSGLTAGELHTCAAGSNGAAYCWGINNWGQHGNGTTDRASTPAEVKAPENVKLSGLAAGSSHTCAEGSDGNAYCWGNGYDGQLGTGTWDQHLTPVKVSAPPGVTLSGLTGMSLTCAYGSNGRVYCWGPNGNGRLGDGTDTGRDVPTPVAGTQKP